MSVTTVLDQVEAVGVVFRIEGEKIRIRFPEPDQRQALAHQIAFLRAHRDEVAQQLRVREGGERGHGTYVRGSDQAGAFLDYYEWRANAALEAICEIPAPSGLIVWLGEHSSFLYTKLTCDLPDKISRAWNARVPFPNFDGLCFNLVDTFRLAAELYHVAYRSGNQGSEL